MGAIFDFPKYEFNKLYPICTYYIKRHMVAIGYKFVDPLNSISHKEYKKPKRKSSKRCTLDMHVHTFRDTRKFG